MSKSVEQRSMFMLHIWYQSQVTIVWNTRETGYIYAHVNLRICQGVPGWVVVKTDLRTTFLWLLYKSNGKN